MHGSKRVPSSNPRQVDFLVGHASNREEKALRHVAMVAKFLNDIKPNSL